jgi:hypothetical protein
MSSTHGTSSTYGTMRDGVRDTVKDAKDAARESGKAVSEAGSNKPADLDSQVEIKPPMPIAERNFRRI